MNFPAEKIRILVVDDHEGVRDGIRTVINAQADMMVVGEATDGGEAVRQFKTLLPDITLADVNLPVICGIEAMALIRAEFPRARFIVVSAFGDTGHAEAAFAAGAQAFLSKDRLRRELLPAIRAVHRGQRYIP